MILAIIYINFSNIIQIVFSTLLILQKNSQLKIYNISLKKNFYT